MRPQLRGRRPRRRRTGKFHRSSGEGLLTGEEQVKQDASLAPVRIPMSDTNFSFEELTKNELTSSTGEMPASFRILD